MMDCGCFSENFKKLADEIHNNSVNKGFWEPGDEENVLSLGTKIALIHSEVSEMLEALRKGDRENEAEEAADILIRLMDYCSARNIDLMSEVMKKHERNKTRQFKHGKLF